jgi:hypothetical protein
MGEPNLGERVAGTAIGDAMGHPTEFEDAEVIRRDYPPDGVRGYELWWEREGKRFAPDTNDTQMAEIVLRALIRGRKASTDIHALMSDIAAGFVQWRAEPAGRAQGTRKRLSGRRRPASGRRPLVCCRRVAMALCRGATSGHTWRPSLSIILTSAGQPRPQHSSQARKCTR